MDSGSAADAGLDDAFQAFMTQAGASRRPAVAVSGGADSMCLAVLARGWGDPLALIVDHGLRPGSSDEAAGAARRLATLGIEARILSLRGLARGPGLASRARAARYQALTAATQDAGRVDMLLGHHRRDQAETFLMRQRAGSGDTGLSGMAAIVENRDVRLLRPLLTVPPGTLRAHLRAAGVAWSEDPSNQDGTTLRARLRAELDDPAGDGMQVDRLTAEARANAGRRAGQDRHCAAELADRVMFFPEGFAVLSPGSLSAASFGALIRAIRGAPYPVASTSLSRLAACPIPASLGGVQLLPAGRLGPGLLVVREAAGLAPAIPALAGTLWDGRFLVTQDAGDGAAIGAVGQDASLLRRHSSLPHAVLRTLPALRIAGALVEVPHIGYRPKSGSARMAVSFAPATPASGAPFGTAHSGDAEGEVHPHLQG